MNDSSATLILNKLIYQSRTNTPLWKVMKENQISVSAHLAVRNGELITEDEIIRPGDVIELIPVVSGG